METSNTSPMSSQWPKTNWRELDEFCYMPEELWPVEATEIDDRYCYRWFRKTPWKPIEQYNEKTKELFDTIVEDVKKEKSDVTNPENTDEFWLKYCDCLITDAFVTRNYVMEEDYIEDKCFPHIQSKLKNFDVVMQTTLGGHITHPFVVYDIEYQDTYYADKKDDDYAKEEYKKFDQIWEHKKYHMNDTDYMHEWQNGGSDDYHKLRVQMAKEGHSTFTVRKPCREYRMKIRWVEHTNDHKTILHKGQY